MKVDFARCVFSQYSPARRTAGCVLNADLSLRLNRGPGS